MTLNCFRFSYAVDEDGRAYYIAFKLPACGEQRAYEFALSGYKTGNKVSDVKATVPGTGKGGQFNFIGLSTSNKSFEDLQNHHITSETEVLEFGKVYYLCFSVASIRRDFVLNQIPLEEFNLVGVRQPVSFYLVEDDPKAGYLCFKLPLLEMKSMSFTYSGYEYGKHCSACNAVLVEQKTVKAKGHNYQNGECTDCGGKQPQQDDGGQKNCSHLCHKSGFLGFIWKIVRFFCKLFKINPVCSCGAKHY